MRKRPQNTCREQIHHFFQQPAGELRALLEQLIDIDAEIRDVVSERPQSDLGVLVVVPLAELEQAPERA